MNALLHQIGDWSIIAGDFFWLLTYLMLIRLAFMDKALGIPVLAVCGNISWEFIYSFIIPLTPPQVYLNILWLFLDIIILCLAIRFRQTSEQEFFRGLFFYPGIAACLLLSFGAMLSMSCGFSDWIGKYAGFGQNLIMSLMFLVMLAKRQDLAGQSIYIALFKLLGSLGMFIWFYMAYSFMLVRTFLYISIFTCDALYLILLYRKHRELGLNPWKKF